uniref:Uncharacterized protein n=1 Tax=Anguilla anguilla TaxID=7936 RepID=A0A0E9R2R0_ANGAN
MAEAAGTISIFIRQKFKFLAKTLIIMESDGAKTGKMQC